MDRQHHQAPCPEQLTRQPGAVQRAFVNANGGTPRPVKPGMRKAHGIDDKSITASVVSRQISPMMVLRGSRLGRSPGGTALPTGNYKLITPAGKPSWMDGHNRRTQGGTHSGTQGGTDGDGKHRPFCEVCDRANARRGLFRRSAVAACHANGRRLCGRGAVRLARRSEPCRYGAAGGGTRCAQARTARRHVAHSPCRGGLLCWRTGCQPLNRLTKRILSEPLRTIVGRTCKEAGDHGSKNQVSDQVGGAGCAVAGHGRGGKGRAAQHGKHLAGVPGRTGLGDRAAESLVLAA